MKWISLNRCMLSAALVVALMMVLMVLPVTAATMESIGNQYYQGGDYKGYQPAPTKDACKSWCLNDERCKKLTWTDPNTIKNPYPDGACWLKDDSALGPYPYLAGDHGESWVKQEVKTRQVTVETTIQVSMGPCDDGNKCTINDYYSDGVCVAGTPLNCDDGNPNTNDVCHPVRGTCIHTPVAGSPCDDGNLCTINDYYDQSGACVAGTPKNCDDGNPITKDTCDPGRGACIHTAAPSGPCDDGTSCNKVFSSKDVLTALQIAVGKLTYSAEYDVNHDGKVDSADAREILKITVIGV